MSTFLFVSVNLDGVDHVDSSNFEILKVLGTGGMLLLSISS